MKAAVIIPTKNRPRRLLSALSSIKVSNNLVVVIVDDLSTPPVADVIGDFSNPYIKVVRNGGAPGPAGARNYGVKMTDAEVVFFLDDDDALVDGYISEVLRVICDNATSADFGFSSVLFKGKRKGVRSHTGTLNSEAPLSNRLGGLGMGFWIKRQCYLEVGGLNELLRINEDTEFFVRLAKLGYNCWFSASPGVEIRPEIREAGAEMASITSSSRAEERSAAFEAILEAHGEFLGSHPSEKLSFVRRAVKYRARSGDFRGALRMASRFGVTKHRVFLDAIVGCVSRRRS